jgi:hemoglobin
VAESTLYDRLGGVFAIAAVIDHFSDAVVEEPRGGKGLAKRGASRMDP